MCNKAKSKVGELVIDGKTSLINAEKTTSREMLESCLLERNSSVKVPKDKKLPHISTLRNTVALGDCEEIISEMPAESADLIFTSPPYFNARPEYTEYLEYQNYLNKMQRIIHKCHRVLNEGRFFVINVFSYFIASCLAFRTVKAYSRSV